jgi:Zn-dependent M16 (insulinase) family peptidase
MPGLDYLPREDAQLQLWLTNFTSIAEANEALLELNKEDIEDLNASKAEYSQKLDGLEAAKGAQRAATNGKNKSKSNVSEKVRRLTRKFKGNPNVNETLLKSLGVVSNKKSGPVVTVTGVKVRGSNEGVNTVKFNRNGNSSSTTFVIEYKAPDSDVWLFGDAITSTKWNHDNQVPGQQIWYRVTSKRAGKRSVPSVPASAYPHTNSESISIAA